ncbi:MAG: hypothetical protein J7L66_02955, partial [Anaerolineaceae bacterium]|nr:hypothetical protein [Anaerolineaceae bacterium]
MGGEQYPVFTNNTFDIGGASAVLKAGLFPLTVLNEFTHFGYLQDDGCAIQIASGGQIGSITTQNWIHDTPKGGIRFDGPQYEDPYIQGKLLMGAMVRNVVWNVMGGGLMVKGDDHRIYNNTTFNTDKAGIRSIAWKRKPGQDYKTILRNNIASDIIGSKRGTSENHPPAGIADHNWTEFKSKKTVKTVLRDPENLEFRPAPNAEIIDAGIPVPQETLVNPKVIFPDFTKDFTVGKVSDIGAYEYGCKNYWIPGFRHSTASTPIPPDKSVTAKSDADLMWKPAYQSKIFMVYFGIEKDKLKMVSKQKVNIYDPGKLMPGKTYYWRIDCSNGEELNKGEIWSFTVFNNKRKSEKK